MESPTQDTKTKGKRSIPRREKIIRRLAKSVIHLGRACVPDMTNKPSPDFHYDMEKHLLDLSEDWFCFVAPRHHAKSSVLACLFVLWHIFFEDMYRHMRYDEAITLDGYSRYEPRTKFVVLISKTQGEAIRRLRTIKNVLEKSAILKKLFGVMDEDTCIRYRENEIILPNGTIITCVGTGQQSRGLKEIHMRPTLVLVDDPEDEENTKTYSRMRESRRWLMQAILPSLDSEVGRCVVIGTPINFNCMVVKLAKAKGWVTRWYGNDLESLTSSWDVDEDYKPTDIKEGLLWPEQISERLLKKHRDTAESMSMLGSYYREHEAKVMGDDDQIFKPSYFKKRWDGELKKDARGRHYLHITRWENKDLETPREVPVNVFTGVDPASRLSDRADSTAIFTIAVDNEDHIYWLECPLRKLLPSDVVEAVAANHRYYQPVAGMAETVSSQRYVVDFLAEYHDIYYEEYNTTDKKKGDDSRLEKLHPLFKHGKVHPREGMDDIERQFRRYPKGNEDDAMDGFDFAQRIRWPATHEVMKTARSEAEIRRSKKYRTKRDPMLS